MINLIGSQKVFKNTFALLSPYFSAEQNSIGDFSTWTTAYHKYLKHIQPEIPNPSDEFNPEKPTEVLEALLNAFNEKSSLSDIEFSVEKKSDPELMSTAHKFSSNLGTIKKTFPELEASISFFIHTVFFAPSKQASGGTTSSAIGVLWANPRKLWTNEDYLEFMVHELTHTLVFLDERRFKHYTNLEFATKLEYLAYSAVLGKSRPVDKVLHSLIVATEILMFREKRSAHAAHRKLHPPTDKLKAQSLLAVESLRSSSTQKLLTKRANELINECEKQLLLITECKGPVANA